MIQYSEAPVLETRSYGVLDTPLARGMTTPGDCLQFIIGRRQSRISLRSIRATVFRHCEERSDEAIHSAAMPWIGRSNPFRRYAVDCFAEPVIGRAFARPVGSQ
jgi:hypothetical protein